MLSKHRPAIGCAFEHRQRADLFPQLQFIPLIEKDVGPQLLQFRPLTGKRPRPSHVMVNDIASLPDFSSPPQMVLLRSLIAVIAVNENEIERTINVNGIRVPGFEDDTLPGTDFTQCFDKSLIVPRGDIYRREQAALRQCGR